MSEAGRHRVGDADGRDLGGGGHALHHGGADHEGQGEGRAAPSLRAAADLAHRRARSTHAQVLVTAAASASPRRAIAPSTTPGTRPPVNSAAIDTPVTEPMVISTKAGRHGLGLRAGGRQQRDAARRQLGAALLHLRNSAGATAAMSAGLGSRDAGRPGTWRRPAHTTARRFTWPSRLGEEKATIALAMPVISISRAEEDEQWHRQQDQVRHAVVHAADDHGQCGGCGQREVAEGAEAEGEGDRDAGRARCPPPRRRKKIKQVDAALQVLEHGAQPAVEGLP